MENLQIELIWKNYICQITFDFAWVFFNSLFCECQWATHWKELTEKNKTPEFIRIFFYSTPLLFLLEWFTQKLILLLDKYLQNSFEFRYALFFSTVHLRNRSHYFNALHKLLACYTAAFSTQLWHLKCQAGCLKVGQKSPKNPQN